MSISLYYSKASMADKYYFLSLFIVLNKLLYFSLLLQDFKALYAMDNNATEIKKIYGLNTAP